MVVVLLVFLVGVVMVSKDVERVRKGVKVVIFRSQCVKCQAHVFKGQNRMSPHKERKFILHVRVWCERERER